QRHVSRVATPGTRSYRTSALETSPGGRPFPDIPGRPQFVDNEVNAISGQAMEHRTAVLLMRHLRLRHIELLNVLSRSRTMHAAADELKLSQPAISKMLREIESTFGTTLFERSKSGVRPTAAGLIAIRLAQIVFNEVSIAAEEMSALQGAGRPVLRLGTVSVTSLVPQAIILLRHSVPDAIMKIREGPVDVLVERLLSGELDCVVGALDPGFLGRS